MKSRCQINLPSEICFSQRRPRFESFRLTQQKLFTNSGCYRADERRLDRITKAETFIKKAHNAYHVVYVDSEHKKQSNDLSSAIKELCVKPDSYYLAITETKQFSKWEKQLLIRDLNELRAIEASGICAKLDKDIAVVLFKSFIQALQFLIKQELLKLSEPSQLWAFMLKVIILPFFKHIGFDLHEKIESPVEYLRAELIVRNIQIKSILTIDGSSSTPEKLFPLYFNIQHDPKSSYLSTPGARVYKMKHEALQLKNLPSDLLIIPSFHHLRIWTAIILGEKGTPHEGGIYYLSIIFPDEYPFRPPRISILNKVFNPQISQEGKKIHLDTLGNYYTPMLSIRELVEKIKVILHEPQESHHESEAKDIYEGDKEKYNSIVKDYVLKYA